MIFDRETPEAAAYAREMLRLDVETGRLYWRTSGGRRKAGAEAGGINHSGYLRVSLMGRYFFAHRIVWMLIHGEWPSAIVDHADRNRANNRPSNLRVANKSLNAQNSTSRSDSRTGLRGVGWSGVKGKYRARISINGHRETLGYFDDPNEAHAAYMEASAQLHPYAPHARQD